MIGDGYCQDGTNKAECNYDGGDCCKFRVNMDQCSDCTCFHQETCSISIASHGLVGNGYCNDETNNEACNYDGGDCCGSCVVDFYCENCTCLLNGDNGIGTSSPTIGNGYCDDGNNNVDCQYDGGDCCGSCVVRKYCSDCQCLGGVTGIGVSSPTIGNGYCDDENNIYDCMYDGLDCCGPNVITDDCDVCTCHSK